MLFHRKFEEFTERLTSIEELISQIDERDSYRLDTEEAKQIIIENKQEHYNAERSFCCIINLTDQVL